MNTDYHLGQADRIMQAAAWVSNKLMKGIEQNDGIQRRIEQKVIGLGLMCVHVDQLLALGAGVRA